MPSVTTDATPGVSRSLETRELAAPRNGRSATWSAAPDRRSSSSTGSAAPPRTGALIAPALAAERRVIVPELPGHGGSAPLPAAPTLDPFADAVLAVLEAEAALPGALGRPFARRPHRPARGRPAARGRRRASCSRRRRGSPPRSRVGGGGRVRRSGRSSRDGSSRGTGAHASASRAGPHAHVRLVGRRRPGRASTRTSPRRSSPGPRSTPTRSPPGGR